MERHVSDVRRVNAGALFRSIIDRGFQKRSISQTVFKEEGSEKVNGILTVGTDVVCVCKRTGIRGQLGCVFPGLGV